MRRVLRTWRRRLRRGARGPTGVAPFETVALRRIDPRRGLHQPERFDGVLHAEPGEPFRYAGGRPLLGQAPAGPSLPDGPRYRTEGIAPPCPRRLYSLTPGGLVGAGGVVYCPRSRLAVAESMRVWRAPLEDHAVLASRATPEPRRLEGCVLNLGVQDGQGFHHFLADAVPRLALARDWLPHVTTVFANGAPGSFHERWLRLAGIDLARIVWLEERSHAVCDQLLFTGYLTRDCQPVPWLRAALRGLFGVEAPAAAPSARLWISRRGARTRHLEWEEALLARLEGFEVLALEDLDPERQIAAMQGAAVVAGPHGAGLTAIVFCEPGTKVVEIFSADAEARRPPVYGRLAEAGGLEHAWAVADFASPRALPELADSITRFLA